MDDEKVQVAGPPVFDVLGADFVAGRDELARLFREGAQRAVAEQLAAGRTVFSRGTTSDEAGKLFMRTPDVRRFEYRMCLDGSREIVREIIL
jgi:hypothetical protein